MKLEKGLSLRKIAGEFIIVRPNLNSHDLTNVYTLNSTSAYLWEEIQGKEFSENDLVELLTIKYEIDKERAKKDVTKLISLFRAAKLIEE